MGFTNGNDPVVAPDTALPGNAVTRFFRSHPIGFWFIFWGEFAARCSFYGMRALLARYMAEQLKLGRAPATTYSSFFLAAFYFLPLLGGYLADKLFRACPLIV